MRPGLVDQVRALRAAANAPVCHLVCHAQTLRPSSDFVNSVVVLGDGDDGICAVGGVLDRHGQGAFTQDLGVGDGVICDVIEPHVLEQMGGKISDACDMRDHQFAHATMLPFLLMKCEPFSALVEEAWRHEAIFLHVNCQHICAFSQLWGQSVRFAFEKQTKLFDI